MLMKSIKLGAPLKEFESFIPTELSVKILVDRPSVNTVADFLSIEPFAFSDGKPEIYEVLRKAQKNFYVRLNNPKGISIDEAAFASDDLKKYAEIVSGRSKCKLRKFYGQNITVKEFLLIDADSYQRKPGVGQITADELRKDQNRLRETLLNREKMPYQTELFDFSNDKNEQSRSQLAIPKAISKYSNRSIDALKHWLPRHLLREMLKEKLDTIGKAMKFDSKKVNKAILSKQNSRQLSLFQEEVRRNPRKLIDLLTEST